MALKYRENKGETSFSWRERMKKCRTCGVDLVMINNSLVCPICGTVYEEFDSFISEPRRDTIRIPTISLLSKKNREKYNIVFSYVVQMKEYIEKRHYIDFSMFLDAIHRIFLSIDKKINLGKYPPIIYSLAIISTALYYFGEEINEKELLRQANIPPEMWYQYTKRIRSLRHRIIIEGKIKRNVFVPFIEKIKLIIYDVLHLLFPPTKREKIMRKCNKILSSININNYTGRKTRAVSVAIIYLASGKKEGLLNMYSKIANVSPVTLKKITEEIEKELKTYK